LAWSTVPSTIIPLLATACLSAATVPLKEVDEVAVINWAETLEVAGALADGHEESSAKSLGHAGNG
jgi:hypothetical protein